jgi:ATP-dependent 26S proteasome regulatory subunit
VLPDSWSGDDGSNLLQRMESYRGVAILATNFKSALDPAFLRRIRFVVSFPFPNAAARAEIWRRIFPAATPTAGIDPERLAQLTVVGGNIRNIAVNAAFMAAAADEPVAHAPPPARRPDGVRQAGAAVPRRGGPRLV